MDQQALVIALVGMLGIGAQCVAWRTGWPAIVLMLAAGFGEMAVEPEHHLGTGLRWIMCAGLSLHILVMTVSAATGGIPQRWLFGWGVPCTLAPVALAIWGHHLADQVVIWLLFLPLCWLALYRPGQARRGRSKRRAATP